MSLDVAQAASFADWQSGPPGTQAATMTSSSRLTLFQLLKRESGCTNLQPTLQLKENVFESEAGHKSPQNLHSLFAN
jgi:hypothetical protein